MARYEEFYRGLLIRKPNLVDQTANLTPPLGIAMYTDPDLEKKPVIELTRMSTGMDRSIYISFKDDVKLAIWDPKERDSFFDQANRGGIKHFFKTARLEHKANVIAAANLISGHVISNMHQAIAGKIEPKSKEMDSDFAKEMLDLSYNEATSQAASLAEGVYTGNLSPTALGYALEKVMRAMDDHWLHKSPTQLFQSIMMSNQQLCDALMDSMKDGTSYVRNLVDQGSEWADRERYFREGFRDFEILTAELHSSVYNNLTEGKRGPDDWSGDFKVKTDLWTPSGEIERHFNVRGAGRHGFDVGPSNFRRYANMLAQIESGVGWKEAGSTLIDTSGIKLEDTRHPILKGTPPDLPLFLAQNRLNFLQDIPGAEESVAELQEILESEEQSREIDLAVFRPESVGMKTAESNVESSTLTRLEEQHQKKQKTYDSMPSGDSDASSGFELLEVDEAQYWVEAHPDFDGEKTMDLATREPTLG